MPPKVDVRRLLKKQQAERSKTTKINHPFAKYDEAGRLNCVVCNSIVKSETVWQAHLGSEAHRDNIQKLKALKQQQQLKRPAPSNNAEQNKRIKVNEEKQDIEVSDENVSSDEEEQQDEDMGLPADFFDAGAETEQTEEAAEEAAEEVVEEIVEEVVEDVTNTNLPAGFFDDPEEEAKVQGSINREEEAKRNLEKDLKEFNEAMVEATNESREVQEEDDELFWQERHLDLSREQAQFDSRVEKLKQLRQSGATNMSLDATENNNIEEDDIKIELKSNVRQILRKNHTQKQKSMFDDDMEDSEEEEDDWRASQL